MGAAFFWCESKHIRANVGHGSADEFGHFFSCEEDKLSRVVWGGIWVRVEVGTYWCGVGGAGEGANILDNASPGFDWAQEAEAAFVHGDGCITNIGLLEAEGDGDSVCERQVWAVVRELNVASEETDVRDTNHSCASFPVNLQVLAGPHSMEEGPYGQSGQALFFWGLGELPHADDYGGRQRFFVGGGWVEIGVASVLFR